MSLDPQLKACLRNSSSIWRKIDTIKRASLKNRTRNCIKSVQLSHQQLNPVIFRLPKDSVGSHGFHSTVLYQYQTTLHYRFYFDTCQQIFIFTRCSIAFLHGYSHILYSNISNCFFPVLNMFDLHSQYVFYLFSY